MTKKDFFILTIKIFGLFSVITNLFSVLPGNISFAIMDFNAFSLAWIAVAVLLVVGLFIFLVFKADKVVNLLKLDKGFEEDRIDFGNLKSADIIKISTFIIGGFLILHNIPIFLSNALLAFKGSMIGFEYGPKEKFEWIMCGINLIIGYLLMTNLNFVAKIFQKVKKEETNNDTLTKAINNGGENT